MIGGFNSIDNKYIEKLNEFIIKHNKDNKEQYIDESHGISHMLIVLCHTSKALESYEGEISDKEKMKVKLAALLHDIDDSKYFPNNKLYENAKTILLEARNDEIELSNKDIDDIIKIISWVSSSVNGDMIPKEAEEKEYLLYPRYADRLEALGIIGVERTLHYTLKQKKKGNPKGVLFTKDTPKATDKDMLFENIATIKRYNSYKGSSDSMIDHFYDKLLRFGVYPIYNKYFDIETKKRQDPLIDIVLYFGKTDDITEDDLEKYIEEYIQKNIKLTTKCMCEEEVLCFLHK
jgi:HD superfamily phosphodiesterase